MLLHYLYFNVDFKYIVKIKIYKEYSLLSVRMVFHEHNKYLEQFAVLPLDLIGHPVAPVINPDPENKQCRHCNKIFSKASNLTIHLKEGKCEMVDFYCENRLIT